MTLEADLFQTLKALVPNEQVYQDTFPQPPAVPAWPAIRFSLVSGVNAGDICGTGGADTDDVTYQLDVVAETSQQANAIAEQVIAAMRDAFPHPNARLGRRAEPFDAATKTFRRSIDYQVSLSSS